MVDISTQSIVDELPKEAKQKVLTKEKELFLLTNPDVMDKIISNLMKDLKLLR